MPLVSLISLSLCLHLCLSHSASLRFLSSMLSVLMLLLLIYSCFFFTGPFLDFGLQSACIFNIAAQGEYILYGMREVLMV